MFPQNGSSASLVNVPSTGNINCYTGLSITNGNSNKIIQSYKCNTSNLNLFNTYDTQIVSIGNKSLASSSNNTGSIHLNSYNTFLCSDVDTNPNKYIGFQVYNNLANVRYKTNASGTYLPDVTVSIQPGSNNLLGKKESTILIAVSFHQKVIWFNRDPIVHWSINYPTHQIPCSIFSMFPTPIYST